MQTNRPVPTVAALRAHPIPSNALIDAWPAEYARAAGAEGWNLFHRGRLGAAMLQRDDEADRFASDADALAYVRAGSEPWHARALAIVAAGDALADVLRRERSAAALRAGSPIPGMRTAR